MARLQWMVVMDKFSSSVNEGIALLARATKLS